MAISQVRGVPELVRTLQRISRSASQEVTTELTRRGQELLVRSQALAPEKTRALVNSATVGPFTRGATGVSVGVSYNTEYAVIRHEDFYNLGPISALKPITRDGPPGRKYLSRPFNAMTATLLSNLLPAAFVRAIRRHT
jgi:hypothetical protein